MDGTGSKALRRPIRYRLTPRLAAATTEEAIEDRRLARLLRLRLEELGRNADIDDHSRAKARDVDVLDVQIDADGSEAALELVEANIANRGKVLIVLRASLVVELGDPLVCLLGRLVELGLHHALEEHDGLLNVHEIRVVQGEATDVDESVGKGENRRRARDDLVVLDHGDAAVWEKLPKPAVVAGLEGHDRRAVNLLGELDRHGRLDDRAEVSRHRIARLARKQLGLVGRDAFLGDEQLREVGELLGGQHGLRRIAAGRDDAVGVEPQCVDEGRSPVCGFLKNALHIVVLPDCYKNCPSSVLMRFSW